MQRSCGISMGCTTTRTVSCPLPTTIAHLPCGQVGKNLLLLRGCTNTAVAQLKWANTAPGLCCNGAADSRDHYRVASGHQKSYPGVISKASTTALPDQLFLNRKGHPLPPSSPRGTNLELKWETHRPLSQQLSGLATATPTFRLSCRIGGMSGTVCSHLTVLQALSTAHPWVTADVKSLRNKDPTTMPPAFKECQNQPAMSA